MQQMPESRNLAPRSSVVTLTVREHRNRLVQAEKCCRRTPRLWRRHAPLAAILLLLLSGVYACGDRSTPLAASTYEHRSIAFIDVAVVPMTAEEVLHHRTVLVEKGRIVRVARVDELQVPDGVLRVDGRGKFLLPGLIDSHVHLEHFADEEQLMLFLANGVTSVRNMDVRLELAVELTVASGTWNCPTLVMHEKSFVADGDRGRWKSEVGGDRVAWPRRQRWRLMNLVDRETAERRVVDEARIVRERIVSALASAGAGILAGTDAGIPFVIPGYSLHDELRYLVGAGLTPYQALRAATVDAARFLGSGEDLGTIEPGRAADLVLLDADPFHDIDAARQLHGVLAGSTWIGPDALEQLQTKAFW